MNEEILFKTPRQRAESLLAIHDGCCAVEEGSDLAQPFEDMEREGLVTITRLPCASMPQLRTLTVRAKGYQPQRETEPEHPIR